MHELAVTESILDIACRHAAQAGATAVTDIYIVMGRLSSIVDDSVQFYWDMVSKDTLCANSRLHFERVPAELQCLDCATTYPMGAELSACPRCQSARIKVLRGDEFRLDSIEITK